ncbi:Calcineurin-like phosphoesterase [Mariniphaga anaerophila]|uniref:Calcineurin-like phosphoesterase n=1 Tax=Mariniphaga anaerophila TaxID=1484053 RepID=A0A1M5DXU0_9BACT|nr:calcineurin-like phosphoesterase family protein [Mariniphaga anaerophila]SHF71765.1 Calcineurin-like phosphoesterase [Mariniphaga anaerophila]
MANKYFSLRGWLFLLSVFFAFGIFAAENSAEKQVSGIVSGQVAENGAGIEGVVVSDGFETTLTDGSGNYRLEVNSEAEFIFISVPSGYKFPNENGVAKFYEILPAGMSSRKINFELQRNALDDTRHAFIVWADPQVKTTGDVQRMMTESVPDIAAHIGELGNIPVHGITCGDIVFEKFNLYADYKKAVRQMNVPFFQVVGNHDIDYSALTAKASTHQFKENFGPTYYSFNRGKIHYVVLNDVFFKGDDEAYKNKRRKYMGHIAGEQLRWLKKDLQYVPQGSTVVVSLHIPVFEITFLKSAVRNELKTATVGNRNELYDIIKPYRVHIMSGHTHYNETAENDNWMEHNHASACNAWWIGNICTDGTPGGYAVYQVSGDDISWYYKPTGIERSFQLRLYPKGESPERPENIVANVWNWDDDWRVIWFEDGVRKGEMERYLGYDPQAYKNMFGSEMPEEKGSLEPTRTEHVFSAKPSENAKEIRVEVTDRFGTVYSELLRLKGE